jgi:hypothetical protein
MKEIQFYFNLLRYCILIIVALQKVFASKESGETYYAIYNLVCIIFRLVFYLSTSI